MNQQLAGIQNLYRYHPLVIEGMGGYDARDPSWVTGNIIHQLNARWAIDPPKKPLVLVTQGDPYEETGIAAITRLVADRLAIQRGMIFSIQTSRITTPNADRYKVIFELPYSSLTNVLRMERPEVLTQIVDSVEEHLQLKNARRLREDKALQDYYRDFALLQESPR